MELRALLASNALGPEMRINSTVAGIQQFSPRSDRSFAVDQDGNLIVAWSSPSADRHGSNIVIRRVDPAGDPLGGEIVVNTTAKVWNHNPVVAASVANMFVVVWEARGHSLDRSGWGVLARVFSSNGTPLTDEIRVNASHAGNQRDPSVAWLSSDRFMVSWTDTGQGRYQTVFARLFQDSRTPLTADIRLSHFARGSQRDVAVVALPEAATFRRSGAVRARGTPTGSSRGASTPSVAPWGAHSGSTPPEAPGSGSPL